MSDKGNHRRCLVGKADVSIYSLITWSNINISLQSPKNDEQFVTTMRGSHGKTFISLLFMSKHWLHSTEMNHFE